MAPERQRGHHAWSRARQWVIPGTLAATTLCWSFSFVSFLEAKEAALWVGLLALCAALPFTPGRRGLSGAVVLAPCWFALGILMAIGLLVGPVTLYVLDEGLRVGALLAFATLSCPYLRGRRAEAEILRVTVYAGFVASLLALGQRAGGLAALFPAFSHYDQAMYSVFGNQGLLGGYLALSLTVWLYLLGAGPSRSVLRRGVFLLAGPVMFAVLLLSQSRGAALALMAGAGCLLLGRRLSFGAACKGIGLALAIVVVLHLHEGSGLWSRWSGTMGAEDVGGNLRPWIWRSSVAMLADHPVSGTGLGQYSFCIPLYLGRNAPAEPGPAAGIPTGHGHLDILEYLCETGLVGLVLLAWILSRFRLRAPGAGAGLAALLVFSLTHPAWHSTPHALAGMLFLSMNMVPRRGVPISITSRLARTVVCTGAVLGGLAFAAFVLYPSFLLCRAEDLHLAGQPAGSAYERAVSVPGHRPEAHESYGIHASAHGDLVEAERQFALAGQGLDTGKVWRLRAMVAEARGDWPGACLRYRECGARWPWDAEVSGKIAKFCGPPGARQPH